jgi:hypothetical protein
MISWQTQGLIVLCGLGGIHALGLAAAVIARLSVGSRCQTFSQNLFLVCLAIVGGATIVALGLWPPCWLASGATLCVMVLTATSDFGRSHRAPIV